MASKKPNAWNEIGAAATDHSPTFEWMVRHHDRIAQTFTGNRVNWPKVVKVLEAEGLSDRTGKTPAPETARKTWFRVRQAVAASRAKAAQKRPSAPTLPVRTMLPVAHTPAAPPCQPAQPPDSDAAALEFLEKFGQMACGSRVRLPQVIGPRKGSDDQK